MGMDDNLTRSLPQAECCYKADKSQAMVSMQMTQQDVSDFSYGDVITGEADLHTLAAIHQKEIAPEIDNLGRRRMTKRWLRASAAQNIYFETVQIVYLEFSITHIACLLVCNVHGECMAKRMWRVNTLALRELEVIP